MIASADLDALFERLRVAGLRVGVAESVRASYLLGQLHESAQVEWLREALRAVLVKSSVQAEAFDEVFASWATELLDRELPHDPVLRTPEVDGTPRPQNPTRPPARPSLRGWLKRHWVKLLGLLLGLCVTGLGVRWLWPQPISEQPDAGLPPPQQAQDLGAAPVRPTKLQRVWIPSITVEPRPLPSGIWRGSVALLGGLVLGSALFLGLRRRRYLPPALPAPTRPGPREIVPTAPPSPGGQKLRLLDVRSQEAMVWGIGRFVAEEKTRQLDVPKTVEATAVHAGMPRLCFVSARHQREVWLWVDESAARGPHSLATELPQLHKELVMSLRQGGLPVEEALYWGLPDRLSRLHESGQVESEFAPSEVAERQDAALVVLLTDGRLLADALDSERYHEEAQTLLRQLAHFPRLAFCDVSRGEYGLASRLAKLDIPVLWPEQVAKFLGGVPVEPPLRQSEQLSGDERLWAAACMLWPYAMDDETMYWVHDRLGLQLPGSSLAKVKQLGQPCGERLGFAESPERPALLGWLRQVSVIEEGPLNGLRERLGPTRLGQLLTLWRERLKQEAEQRKEQDGAQPWTNTPAQQQLAMQQALIELWDQPTEVAPKLHALGGGWLRSELSAHLSKLGPLELAGHRELVILPWHEQRLPVLAQGILRELGFGGHRPRPEVKTARPGRLLAAWLGTLGLAVGGVAVLGQGLWQFRHPHGEPHIRQENAPKDAQVEAKKQSETEYLVTAKSGAEQASEKVRAGSEVLVSWTQEDREPEDGGTESPKDMGADLASPPDLSQPEDLAKPEDLRRPKGGPDLAKPPRPPRDMTVVAAEARDLATVPTVPALGAAAAWSCPYEERTIQGMVFVKVCGGDFLMGSADDDRDAYRDEKPTHPVHVDTFWIGKYEVSNQQYRKKEPGHKGWYDKEELPVESVSWKEARAYCRGLGGDLPTEAEWEYAARGPEGRKYPWGSAKPEAGCATFGRGYSEGPEAITANAKGSGPFGCLNQAGNVWEWVTDCFDESRYAQRKAQSDNANPPRPVVNPVDDRSDCDRRVVRGGSFSASPGILRSAVRDRHGPEVRNWYLGFRCVIGSHRQR